MADPDPLDPVATDGSPAAAFATHQARANGIAKHFALTRRLKDIKAEQAGEDNTTTLIAHCHMLGWIPASPHPAAGAERHRDARRAAPAQPRQRPGGHKGASTERDYDMAVKGLVVLPIATVTQLGHQTCVDFILNELVPDHLVGGHPPADRDRRAVVPRHRHAGNREPPADDRKQPLSHQSAALRSDARRQVRQRRQRPERMAARLHADAS